jgi:hypothetical protein
LPLEQRVAGEADAPGSQPDPEETPLAIRGIEDVRSLPDGLFPLTDEAVSAMEEAGFVSALVDTRFYPSGEGTEHIGDERHLATLVIRMGSDEGAADVADLLHDSHLKPCPGSCAVAVSTFEADDIPDAQGIARVTTAERLEDTGEDGDPFSVYKIIFADGPFVYELDMFGPPDKVSSQQELEEIAKKLYERVEGSPPLQQ